jgi:hypothetical protein
MTPFLVNYMRCESHHSAWVMSWHNVVSSTVIFHYRHIAEDEKVYNRKTITYTKENKSQWRSSLEFYYTFLLDLDVAMQGESSRPHDSLLEAVVRRRSEGALLSCVMSLRI